MLRITNTESGRTTDYAPEYLRQEARRLVKVHGWGRLRGWHLEVFQGTARTPVRLVATYLDADGEPQAVSEAL